MESRGESATGRVVPFLSKLLLSGPQVFVWGGFALLSLHLFSFLGKYSVDLPFYDEWEMVPALTGNQSITLEWLWSQHNEHRIVIGRLFYLAVLELARFDFRSMPYVMAILLMGTSALLIECARRLRGRTEYSDLFFPLVVLGLGQFENLVWGFQISFVLPAAMISWILVLAMRKGAIRFRSALVIAIAAAASPLFGGNGIGLTPALVVLSVLNGWHLRNRRRGWLLAAAVWSVAASAIAIGALYFTHYERPAKHPPSHELSRIVDFCLELVLCGFGDGVQAFSEETRHIVLGVAGVTLAMMGWMFILHRGERARVTRIAALVGAIGCVILGLSWARSAFGSAFSERYATLVAPLWCACYLAWELPRSSAVRHTMQMVLFAVPVALLIPNRDRAASLGKDWRDSRLALLNDLKSGVGAAELGRRHGNVYYGGAVVFAERMKMLRSQGLEKWKALKD